MVKDIKAANSLAYDWFPRLQKDKKYEPTSEPYDRYNCIAWAMRLTDRWVDIKRTAGHWWPIHLTYTISDASKDSLIAAFKSLKFEKCSDDRDQFFYDKVALYFNPYTNCWTHAARILRNGEFHSKLGETWDIHHGSGINLLHNPKKGADSYGLIYQYMRRPKYLRVYSYYLMLIRAFENIVNLFRY